MKKYFYIENRKKCHLWKTTRAHVPPKNVAPMKNTRSFGPTTFWWGSEFLNPAKILGPRFQKRVPAEKFLPRPKTKIMTPQQSIRTHSDRNWGFGPDSTPPFQHVFDFSGLFQICEKLGFFLAQEFENLILDPCFHFTVGNRNRVSDPFFIDFGPLFYRFRTQKNR